MSSQTDILNTACIILGQPPVSGPTDPSVRAVTLMAMYDQIRRKLLEGVPIWRFSVKRASLPQLSQAPVSGPYRVMYQVPSDYVRAVQVGDTWAGLDLTDYRMGPTDGSYQIEGTQILCDYGSPLSLQYVFDATDTTTFDPHFCVYFGAELAWWTCEAITNSTERQQLAAARKESAKSDAAASNALVRAPEFPADDTWILSRLQ